MLKGKVAVVTGGTRGIGYSTVLKFLENGARVVLFGSRKESVDKAISSLLEINANFDVVGYYPNLSDLDEVRDTFRDIYNKYGHIDILVNNAGISSSTSILDYGVDEIDKIIDINIKAVFNCSKVVSEFMKDTGGVILNTSSMVSIYGQASGSLYPASKGAVNMLTKSLARELGKYNIRVNAVAPGVIETDMVKALSSDIVDSLKSKIPLSRLGRGDDIANAFLFLASDMASYITGEILQVDGGVVS